MVGGGVSFFVCLNEFPLSFIIIVGDSQYVFDGCTYCVSFNTVIIDVYIFVPDYKIFNARFTEVS